MRAGINGHHAELHAALDQLLASGGKRIRPTITLLAGGMLGTEDSQLINLAAAIELLHTATLVHDDLIDGSLLRRGIPTLNAELSPAVTILTGDYLFARAAQFAADTESVEIVRSFAQTISTIVNGEITQLLSRDDLDGHDNYIERIYAKTASMFEMAAAAPAHLSALGDEVYITLQNFGRNVGMAFQIVDDILDFTSDQTLIGKPVASDLRNGLMTLPTIYYFEMHPDKSKMIKGLNGGPISEEVVDNLVDSIRQSGAIEMASEDARKFVDKGIKSLFELPSNPNRDALENLADFVLTRVN